MTISLTIKEKAVVLILQDNDSVVAQREWMDENNLSETFLPHLDELLIENKLSIEDIENFTEEIDSHEGSTTSRIARTIIKTLNFAKK